MFIYVPYEVVSMKFFFLIFYYVLIGNEPAGRRKTQNVRAVHDSR